MSIDKVLDQQGLDFLVDLVVAAGEAIMAIYARKDQLANMEHIDLYTFFLLCHLENLNILYIVNKCFYSTYDIEEQYIDISNTKLTSISTTTNTTTTTNNITTPNIITMPNTMLSEEYDTDESENDGLSSASDLQNMSLDCLDLARYAK
jgi:hypothetical protein